MEINNQSMNNEGRSGRFTSSKVWQLIDPGKSDDFDSKGLKYITEKAYETMFETTLDTAPYNEAMAWGNVMEQYVFEQIGWEYDLVSKGTLIHPKHPYWSGTPDCTKKNDVGVYGISEIKCYQKKKFAFYALALMKKDIEFFKAKFPQEYWQIVSNACLMGVMTGEALLFMPYRSQYEEIKEIVENTEWEDPWKYRFIMHKDINDLAFLPDDGFFDSVIRFEFKVPMADKVKLTKRIKLAEERKQSILSEYYALR